MAHFHFLLIFSSTFAASKYCQCHDSRICHSLGSWSMDTALRVPTALLFPLPFKNNLDARNIYVRVSARESASVCMCMWKTGKEKKWNVERKGRERCDMQGSRAQWVYLYHIIHKYTLIEAYPNRIWISSIWIVTKTYFTELLLLFNLTKNKDGCLNQIID